MPVVLALSKFVLLLNFYRIRDGLRHILSISRLGNIHIQESKPWVLVKGRAEDRYIRLGVNFAFKNR